MGLPLFRFGGGRVAKQGEKKAGGRARDEKNGRFLPVRPRVKTAEVAGKDEKPLRPRECRGYLRRELARSFRGIVDGFVKQAESGSVQHLKLANELLGEARSKKQRKGSAVMWAEMLRADVVGGAGETP